jgi:ketosteroid isomerase-like protein
LGGYERGWEQVIARYGWVSARFKKLAELKKRRLIGRVQFENLSLVATADLACSVDIERSEVLLEGRDDVVPMALRVTTIWRREDEGWKIVHRHADPLVAIQTSDPLGVSIERK